MRRSLAVHAVHTILAVLLTRVLGVMIFINPPPIGPLDDFSHNPIYPVGSTVEVQWTRGVPDQGVSLTFFQMNGRTPRILGIHHSYGLPMVSTYFFFFETDLGRKRA